MRTEEEKFFDEVVNGIVMHFYSLSKENKKIILKDFKNTESHKCILCILQSIKDMLGIEIEIAISLPKYWLFKLQTKIKDFNRSKEKDGISLSEIIKLAEKVYESEGILDKIYKAYYKKEK